MTTSYLFIVILQTQIILICAQYQSFQSQATAYSQILMNFCNFSAVMSSGIDYLHEIGLKNIHYQIIISLPKLLDIQNGQIPKNLLGTPKCIQILISQIFQKCRKINISNSYNEVIDKILCTIWPCLIRADPTNFIDGLKYLQRTLNLSQNHVCFMLYIHNKNPSKLPAFCLKNTLQYFGVKQNQIKNDMLVNVVIGQECLQSFLSIMKINTHKQLLLSEQNEFVQQQLKVSSMSTILQKLLTRQTNTASYIDNYIKDETIIVKNLDQWLITQGPDETINIFRLLKIIVFCEYVFEIKNSQNTEGGKNQQPILKVIQQTSIRALNRLFSNSVKEKMLLLDWILQGKIWQNNQQLKKSLVLYMVTCFQIHKKQPQNQSNFLKKIITQENLIVNMYIMKVKNKYYNTNDFISKVPKCYLKINLGIIEQINKIDVQVQSLIVKNSSGTVSLNKLTGQSIKTITEVQPNLKTSNLSKLIKNVFIYTQNLQMHVVYIILLVLNFELNNQNKDNQQTDQQQKRNQYYDQQKKSSLMKLFHHLASALNQYKSLFSFNKLAIQIHNIVNQFPFFFNFSSIKEIQKIQLYDMELYKNNQLNLENISLYLLKNLRYYKLITIYQLQKSQKQYRKKISQNNKNLKNVKQQKNSYQNKQHQNNKESFFISRLCLMIKLFTKKQLQRQYLQKVVTIYDRRISRTLYLNLIYYTLLRITKSPKAQKQRINKSKQVKQILSQLLSYYFLNQTKQHDEVLYILGTAHKILQNWKRSTQRASQSTQKDVNILSYNGLNQQKNISQFYWQILVNSTNPQNYILYSKKFQKINCIKQSIYFMHLYQKRQFPIRFTINEAQWVFNLYSRLQNGMQQIRKYVIDKITRNSIEKKSNDKQRDQREKVQGINSLSWLNQLKLLTNNLNVQVLCSVIQRKTSQIYQLQDVQQIDQVLHQVYLCACYFEAIRSNDYKDISQRLKSCYQADICLSIVKCLQIRKTILQHHGNQNQKIMQIQNIVYSQKLRFGWLDQLQHELDKIPPENMNIEQLRTCIILYSKKGQFDLVRQYFRKIKNTPQKYKQQLEFYNMQAGYKSMMLSFSDKIIDNLEKIIKYIQQQKQEYKISKSSTNSFFEAFKFICQNYQKLQVQQQIKITKCLNRYLKKVYGFKNQALSIEAAYFILRYILIQSNNVNQLVKVQNIFPFQNYNAYILEPHRFFLISSIGQSPQKNQFIKKILIKIAQNNPKASSWWIFSLKNHCQFLDKKSMENINFVDKITQKIGAQIYDQIKKKFINLDTQFEWISWLVAASPGSDLKRIPDNMVSPFSKDIVLQKVVKISPLGHGKSKPVIIQFKVTKNKSITHMFIIRKLITNLKTQFRTQSATANFFKDSKLLDQAVTYSICHLSKYCLLVQYIEHKGSLDSLLINKLQTSQANKYATMIQVVKDAKLSVLGHLYDKKEYFINFQLQSFFLDSNINVIKSWWEKYMNFLKTYAQWCFLGYIVGLGDRHTNNILVTQQGKVIHIDFQYIFDSGKMLPYPQWVPFRLTRGLLNQLSIIQPYGIIFMEFIKTAKQYQEKNRQIWHAESHFSFMKKKNMCNQINKRAQLLKRPIQESLILFERATSPKLLRDMFIGWSSFK